MNALQSGVQAPALGAQLRSRRGGGARTLAAAPQRQAPARANRTVCAGGNAPPAASAGAEKYKVPQIDAARARMYEATFAGVGAPEWNDAVCLSNREVVPGVRLVTLEVEISREIVPIRGAYTAVGRKAKVKVGANAERLVTVASPPFPAGTGTTDAGDAQLDTAIRGVLLKLRNDLVAHAVKQMEEATSIRAPLQLWVGPKEAPELAALQPGDSCQTGYFLGGGLQLRPLLGIFAYPVVLLFVSGRGIATAKALIECTTAGGLTLASREDARLYYSAPVEGELAFVDAFPEWERRGVKVRPAVLTPAAGSPYTPGGVREAFDADDVMYDPALTGVVILGDEAFEKEVLELMEDAGIAKSNCVLGSVEAPPVEYMKSVKFAPDDDAA